jgi:hypothetical protein
MIIDILLEVFFLAPAKIALHSCRPLCAECRFELPDISNPGTPPAAASGDLSLPVYGPCDGMQNEIHALAWRRGGRVDKETHCFLAKHGRGIRTDRKPRANNRHIGDEKWGFAERVLTGETPLCSWRGRRGAGQADHRLLITEVETFPRDRAPKEPDLPTNSHNFVRERVVYADTFGL